MEKKKGFTLIELLAVIIILAVIALIATPVLLNVVSEAKESARKSSVAGYADTVRLALIEKQFETKTNPSIDETFLSNLIYQGDKVSCNDVINSNNYGIILHECNVGDNTNLYCFAMGRVSSCDDSEYIKIYDEVIGVSKEYTDNSGANRPELDDGMIPIYFDGNTVKKADITEKWYDYNNKEWANAILVTDATRETYKNAVKGTIIDEADVLAYYVWVPRYKYELFNVEADIISPISINIEFESKEISKSTGNTDGTYLTHPAFTFGSLELNGIWVGKFETTGTSDIPTIKPNTTSLRNQNISTQFITAKKFNNSMYGLGGDVHLMKNTEWGAVVYLSHSEYGINTEIRINNNSDYLTGCGASTENGTPNSVCEIEYGKNTEYPQSTTGNITGIFDMSGGAFEYVMGNMLDSNGDFSISNSGFASPLESKYYDSYEYGTTSIDHNHRILGDATGEVRKWYSDYSNFVFSSVPWFIRGGSYNHETVAGGFSYYSYDGNSQINFGFRTVQLKI